MKGSTSQDYRDVLDRIEDFRKRNGLSVSAFINPIEDMSWSTYDNAIKKGAALGLPKFLGILGAYPSLNPVWVIYGEGEMIWQGIEAWAVSVSRIRAVSGTAEEHSKGTSEHLSFYPGQEQGQGTKKPPQGEGADISGLKGRIRELEGLLGMKEVEIRTLERALRLFGRGEDEPTKGDLKP